jgi:hypothetical protein
LISATSTVFLTSSEQVSPWDPKTHFHDFVPALVGAFLPQTQWAKIKIFAVLPMAREMKTIRATILQKVVARIFFLPRKLCFQNICGSFAKIYPHYLEGKVLKLRGERRL